MLVEGRSPSGAGAWLLLTAPTSKSLRQGADALTAQEQWSQIPGRIASYNGETGKLSTQPVTTFAFLATQPFSLGNMRLIFANWLSENILAYSVLLLSTCVLLGLGTSDFLSRIGRKAHDCVNRIRSSLGLPPLGAAAFVAARRTTVRAGSPSHETSKPGTDRNEQWLPWRDRFITADGRIVDDANRNISHSEGQGYGLLLAVMAEDRAAFDRIWSFTKGSFSCATTVLAAGNGSPTPSRMSRTRTTPPTATSSSPIRSGWPESLARPGIDGTARDLTTAIGRVLVKRVGDLTVLMPAAKGFGSASGRTDPSSISPTGSSRRCHSWRSSRPRPIGARLRRAGGSSSSPLVLDLTSCQQTGSPLPPPRPPQVRPAFGYDAIRIPLYLVRAGPVDVRCWSRSQSFGRRRPNRWRHQARRRPRGQRMSIPDIE